MVITQNNVQIEQVRIISLEHRSDRRKLLTHQIKTFLYSLPKPTYFIATKHEMGGVYGCKSSHLAVLRQAQQTLTPHGSILILEDDVVFKNKIQPQTFPPIPTQNWDILMLGHNLHHISFDQHIPSPNSPPVWLKAEYALTTHAYIVNKQSISKLIHIIETGNIQQPIDVLYAEAMYMERLICYAYHPIIAVQLENEISDIEHKIVNYQNVLEKPMIQTCTFKIYSDTRQIQMILKHHPKNTLPPISIVTLHHNRPEFVLQMWHNIKRQDYPKHLIQWIIVDDSIGYDLISIAPSDMKNFPGLLHVKIANKNIPSKRNVGCQMAVHDIIIHMDDDDLYLDQYISYLVNVLMDFPHINCVGATLMNCYDLTTGASFRVNSLVNSIAEASMAFRKDFWVRRPFNESFKSGEGHIFLYNRFSECMQIPCTFLMYAITHGKNITTTRTRTVDKPIPIENDFWGNFPLDARVIMSKIKTQKIKT